MIRGIGASRAGMAFEQQRTEVIANNVANIGTDGFKRSVAVGTEFAQMLLQRLGDPVNGLEEAPGVGLLGHGSMLAQVVSNPEDGALRQTDSPLDVALLGAGEFTYQGPTGPAYTRSGNFHQDTDGHLVTAQGYPVLVGGAPVGQPGSTIQIASDGTVLVDGEASGKLDIRGGEAAALTVKALETSNVDMSLEMTDLIVALRSFQVNQRALQMQDQTVSRAVNEIGKL